jgi:hypothetical protein
MFNYNLWCMKYFGAFAFLIFLSWQAAAQSSREVATPQKQGSQYNSTQKIKKVKKRKKGNQKDQLIAEYEQRMKDNAKAYNKAAKEMEKPQYSDPSYFGHKRPPKKRPVGKRKFCKECGIVH